MILDRQLSFGPNVKMINEKLSSKFRIPAVVHSEWGWKKQYLKRLYTSLIKSIINYAGFAWQSSVEETNVKALERLQSKALRFVTGQIKTT